MAIGNVNGKGLINAINEAAKQVEKSSSKLSSGKRITKASDDAAGMAIVAALEAQTRTLNQAKRNAADGVSITDIAGSTLSTVSDISTRQQELAMQAANGSYSDDQRKALNDEYQALEQEKQRQLQTAEFNGTKIFNGSETSLQVGNDGTAESRIDIPSVNTAELAASVADISNVENARHAIDDLATKIGNVSQLQGQIGAARNRVELAGQGATNSAFESEAAASRIRDVDVAQEVANHTRANILLKSSTALSAQANQNSALVLNLLQ